MPIILRLFSDTYYSQIILCQSLHRGPNNYYDGGSIISGNFLKYLDRGSVIFGSPNNNYYVMTGLATRARSPQLCAHAHGGHGIELERKKKLPLALPTLPGPGIEKAEGQPQCRPRYCIFCVCQFMDPNGGL